MSSQKTKIRSKSILLFLIFFLILPLPTIFVKATTETSWTNVYNDYLGNADSAFIGENVSYMGRLFSGSAPSVIVDINPDAYGDQKWNIGAYYVTMNFTAPSTTTITEVQVFLNRYGGTNTETIKVQVRTDSGGYPTSTTVGTGAEESKSISGSGDWYSFSVSIPIVSGTKYHLWLHQTTWDTTTPDGVQWWLDTGAGIKGKPCWGVSDPPTTQASGDLATKLIASSSTLIVNAVVYLEKSVSGSWVVVDTEVTDASGYVHSTISESINGTFSYRWNYLGNVTYDASTSSTMETIADFTSTWLTSSTVGGAYWVYDQRDSLVAPNVAGKTYSQTENQNVTWISTKETGNILGLLKFLPNTVIDYVYVLTGGTRGYPLCSDSLNVYVPSSDSGHLNVFVKGTNAHTSVVPVGSGYPLAGVSRDPSTGYIWSVATGITYSNQYMVVYFPNNASYKTWDITALVQGGQAANFGFIWQNKYWTFFKKGNPTRLMSFDLSSYAVNVWGLGITSDYPTTFPNGIVFDGVKYLWMNHYGQGKIYKIDLSNINNPVLVNTYSTTLISGNGLDGIVYFYAKSRWVLGWTSYQYNDVFFVWDVSKDLINEYVDRYYVQNPPTNAIGMFGYCGQINEVYGARVVDGVWNVRYARIRISLIPPPEPPIPKEWLEQYFPLMLFIVGFVCFFLPLGIMFWRRPDPATCIKLLMVSFIGFAMLMFSGSA